MKDPRVVEPKKPHASKAPTLQRSGSSETSEQARKEKKKKDKQHRGQDLKTPPQPPGLIQQIPWEAIQVAVEGLNPKKTIAKSSVIIVTKRATMQPST